MNALLACMLFGLTAAAPHHAFVLKTETSVWDVSVEDLNQDGRGDIIALCCDEKSYPLKKEIAVFLAGAEETYPNAPSIILPLDPSIGAAFLTEATGAAPKELVVADAASAAVHAFEGGAFRLLKKGDCPSLLPSGSKKPRFLPDAAADLTGRGVDEWFIPVASGYRIRDMDRVLCTVPCDVMSEIRDHASMYIVHRLPACELFDIEGERQKGLAFLSDEFADFAHGPGWEKRERFRIPLNLEEKWEAASQMKDIDGNGFPDLVVTQMQGSVNLKVLTQVYIASEPFTYPENPTATFQAAGAIASPLVIDVDGDQRLDIAFVKIPFGVKSLINFFLLRKLGIQVDVHLFDGQGYPAEPNFRTSVSIDAPDGQERAAYTMGDFNGDGRIDVAFGAGADKMVIRTGTDKKFLSPRPWVTLDLPTFGTARPYDLNGNDAEDLVVFHPGGDNKQRIEVVVF